MKKEIPISNTYVYLGIFGDFDPETLIAEIGADPTSSAAKHSRDPGKGLPRNSTLRFAQTHATSSDEVIDVYGLADDVIGKLSGHEEKLANAIRSHDVTATLQVVLDFPVSDAISTPIIGFSKEVIRFVSEIGASIDIDTYRA